MFQKLKTWFYKTPWYIRNIYTLTILFFLFWMCTFDRNNVFQIAKLNKKLKEMEKKIAFYNSEIEKDELRNFELFSTDENKERFARENFYMKKPNEDIFVIVEE